MTEPFDEIARLAREASTAPISRDLHEHGRRRLLQYALGDRVGSMTHTSEPARGGRKWWVGTSIAAAAVLALVTGALFRARPLTYEVQGGNSFSTDYVSAPADHTAELRFSDGTEIHALAGTRLRVDETRQEGARILLERGEATASVRHRENSNWSFVAGPFEVHVTGTEFTLGWDPAKEEFDLAMREGSVEVSGPGSGRFVVRTGQRFRASLADGSLRVENLDSAQPAAPVASAAMSAGSPAPSASASSELVNPVETRPATPHEESWPVLVRRGKFQQVVSAARARGVEGCLSSCSASDLRALADAARYSGKLDLAESSLLALRKRFKGASADSAAAAFLLGRISESRGQLAAANRWYEFSSQEAPKGEFAADALAGRMRAVAATQGTSSARPLAEQYLERYPEGVHARAARKIVGLE